MTITRRSFVALLPAVLFARPAAAMRAKAGPSLRSGRQASNPKHPTPRPGITAAKVLPDAKVEKSARKAFAMVREIPQVVDGIRCNCGCAELEGFYSLLSCYEQNGMAQHCAICQGQAKLAHKMHKDGFSLDAIRRAIDAEYGE